MASLYEAFTGPWFSATFHWLDGLLTGVELNLPTGASTPPRSPFGQQLRQIIEHYDTGSDWPDLPLATEGLTPFRRSVLEILRTAVPRGSTITYGRLATLAGSTRAARAAGHVMATNPWPLVIPCHRVLAGNGLGGFGPGTALKLTLLTLEKALLPR